jgi:hypothetical protein
METRINEKNPRMQGIALGIVLIAIGALFIVARTVNVGALVLVVPGVVMLALGILMRSNGWLIPGGIVSGLGVGALFEESGMSFMRGLEDGVAVLFGLAVGFTLITITSAIVSERKMWWPLIPGVLLALIGLGMQFGGPLMAVLEFVGAWWPVALIVAGAAVLAAVLFKRQQA